MLGVVYHLAGGQIRMGRCHNMPYSIQWYSIDKLWIRALHEKHSRPCRSPSLTLKSSTGIFVGIASGWCPFTLFSNSSEFQKDAGNSKRKLQRTTSLALLGSGELGVRTVRVLRNGDGKKTKGFKGVICIASANQKGGELVFLYT